MSYPELAYIMCNKTGILKTTNKGIEMHSIPLFVIFRFATKVLLAICNMPNYICRAAYRELLERLCQSLLHHNFFLTHNINAFGQTC